MNLVDVAAHLRQLKKEGYIFHGSPYNCAVLEPRTPVGDFGFSLVHGRTGVFATTLIEVALAKAMCGGMKGWGWQVRESGHVLRQTKVKIVFAADSAPSFSPGWVHILSREGFEKVERYTLLAQSPVAPVEVVHILPELSRYFRCLEAHQFLK